MPALPSPRSGFSTAWQIVVVAVTTGYVVLLPLDWIFGLGGVPLVRLARWLALAVFVADIVISATVLRRMPFVRSGEVVYSIHDYRRGLLGLDILAALPIYALTGDVRYGLFGVIKLAKVSALLGAWRRRAVRYETWVLLGYGAYWLVLFGHWLSCGWLALEGMPEGSSLSAYIRGVYWTVTTVTGVGYGDITPSTDGQRVYAVLTMLVGLSFFGYVVGVFARILSRRDPATERFRDGVERLAQAAALGGLPKDLRDRVYDYHWYVWQNALGYDEGTFLAGLPDTLRGEVSFHLKKHLLNRVTLFHETGEDFLLDIAPFLRPKVFTPGDVVFESGDQGDEMYFIARGALEILDAQGLLVEHLGEGDFFGETALFREGPRLVTARVLEYSQLYVLDRRAIARIGRKHPGVYARIEDRAEKRRREEPDAKAEADL